jgi:DsbC/DsbD-like thiol-disulfide interchange protein
VTFRKVRSLDLAVIISFSLLAPASAEPLSTSWVAAHGARARLIAGHVDGLSNGKADLWAGVEIQLDPGWKTYWRRPGDSGGLPPHFDWSRSKNIKAVTVLYPAPRRFKDAIGDSVGYSGAVLFPVKFQRENEAASAVLHLSFQYGICREICIPAEAEFALTIPPHIEGASPEISAALAQVPRPQRRPEDPELISREAKLEDQPPKLALEARFPKSADTADMFIEAEGSTYVPLPVKTGAEGDTVRFEVDLSEGLELDELRGANLTITMVSERGQAEATWKLP